MSVSVRPQKILAGFAVAASLLLVGALYAAFVKFDSQLALAQAADSFMDVFTASVLAFTVTIAARPRDENHPFGHTRAEPIGALVAAVVAGVLAFEVARNAISALAEGASPQLSWLLVVIFGAKALIKLGVMFAARALRRRARSPAMNALAVDARNDVLVSLLAIAGFLGMKWGMPLLDAALAIPVAMWIALAGFNLARENIKLLMGEAPPQARQDDLLALVRGVPGVESAEMRAHYVGTLLHLHIDIVVDTGITLAAARQIGEAVRRRLETEDDVGHCSVHFT